MARAWMPLYIGDYLADTYHLTTLQHGAYLLLIMHYWQHGGLPSDEQAIAKICGFSRYQWNTNCQALAKLFLPGWKHKRIDRELEKLRLLSETRAVSGYKGGKASRGKNNNERFIFQAIAKQAGAQSDSDIESSLTSEPRTSAREEAEAPRTGSGRISSALADVMKAKGWIE